MKRKLIFVLAVYIILAGIILWLGSDRLPKDPVARYMVQENAGKIHFAGTRRVYFGGAVYNFMLTDYDDPELLSTIIQTFKDAIRKCDPDYRWFYRGICLWESYTDPNIKSATIDILDYYDSNQRYDDFQCIEISGFPAESPEAIYNHADTYLQLKNVKTLVVTPKIDRDAKENGIDWFEVWPELEHYEVREMNSLSKVQHPEKTALTVLSVITILMGIIIWLKRENLPKTLLQGIWFRKTRAKSVLWKSRIWTRAIQPITLCWSTMMTQSFWACLCIPSRMPWKNMPPAVIGSANAFASGNPSVIRMSGQW